MSLRITRFLHLAGLVALLASVSLATPVTGDLRILRSSDCIEFSALNFSCEPLSGLVCNEATQGNLSIGNGQAGSFTSVCKLIRLDQGFEPSSGNLSGCRSRRSLLDFITFALRPDYHIDLPCDRSR